VKSSEPNAKKFRREHANSMIGVVVVNIRQSRMETLSKVLKIISDIRKRLLIVRGQTG